MLEGQKLLNDLEYHELMLLANFIHSKPILTDVEEWSASGISNESIAEMLNRRGLVSLKGRSYDRGKVRELLRLRRRVDESGRISRAVLAIESGQAIVPLWFQKELSRTAPCKSL